MQGLKTRSDWLLRHRVSFAIHVQATCAGFAAKNVVVIAGINELQSSFSAILSHYLSIILKRLFTGNVSAHGGYLPCRFTTSTSVNSC